MTFERALITGASRGLGRALALELAAQGTHVVLVSRTLADVQAVAREVRDAGGRADAIEGDVGQDALRVALLAQDAGPIDLLINNASTLGQVPLPLLLDLDPQRFSQALETNVVGPLRLIQALAGPMVLAEHGAVVNISSDAAVEHYPEWGGYAASKAALDHLSATLAAELDGTGVRVLAVDPGEMDTAMHAAAVPDADPASLGRPQASARGIVAALHDPQRFPSGARFRAQEV